MKLSQFFIISGSTASFSEFCKKLDRETCSTKSLCQWNGSHCDEKNTSMLTESEKQSIKSNYQKALGKTMVIPRAGNLYDRQGVDFADNILGDGYGKGCPVEVPWCERSPCNGHMSELNTDSEACFRQRGCCFDSTLYLYRDSIGESFAEGVPVCYKAINNPIFDEITKTGYDINSIDEKANQILSDYHSNVGKKETLKKLGCSPSDDDVFGRIGFIHVLSKGNHRLRNAITQIDGYHEFIDFVSPLCGWTDISSSECFLIGCCWNEKSEKCGGPLEKIFPDRVDAYLTALETKYDFKDESCEITEEAYPTIETFTQLPIVTTSLTPQTPGPPDFGSFMPAAFMPSNVMININRNRRFSQLNYGYTQTQSGVNVESICQARDNSSRCMDSCVTDVFNYAKKPHMEALCKARGCCFDNAQYEKITQDKDYVKKHCPYASYASGVYDFSFYPSIKNSVKGCCDVSLCINNQPPKIVTTPAPSISPIPIGQFVDPQPVQWTAWSMWSACTDNSRTRTRKSGLYKVDEETDDCNIGYGMQYPGWFNADNLINIFTG